MDSVVDASMESFEKQTQKHEKKIVIDLGMDRIIQFVSMYLIAFLAIPTIIFVIIGPVLTCIPSTTCINVAKSAFTDSFCWGSNTTRNHLLCEEQVPLNNAQVTNNHKEIKFFYESFPFILLGQIFVFMLCWSFWHFYMGARLTGQIKFMKWFLKALFRMFKRIERGRYGKDEPFDEESTSFNGKEKYISPQSDGDDDNEPEISEDVNGGETARAKQKLALMTCQAIIDECSPDKNLKNSLMAKYQRYWNNFLNGNMKDRHLFSMFCYENFVSLEYFPYIVSVFQASAFAFIRKYTEPQINYYNMLACILYQWSHPKNFSNTRLTTVYFLKHVIAAVLALANVIFLVTWYFWKLGDSKQSLFRCFLPNERSCVACKIHRMGEMFFFFWLDVALLFIVFLLSVYQWYTLSRYSHKLAMCHYFDRIMQSRSIAFEAAQSCIEHQKEKAVNAVKNLVAKKDVILIDSSLLEMPEIQELLS